MKKYTLLILLFFTLTCNIAFAHVDHYKKIKLLKYDLFLNNKLIGTHIFEFEQKKDLFYVFSEGNFKVNKLGVVLLDYQTESEEIYKNGQLVKYTSKTIQNNKKKFANIFFKQDKLYIDGSSFKGETEKNTMLGNWWNHEIVKISKQISPISGRINKQNVKFLGKKNISIKEKNYNSLHFHFISDDNKPIEKKKINIEIWYDSKTLLWIKASYEKFGKWEYRLSEVK